MAFRTINILDAYSNPITPTINTDQISVVEIIGTDLDAVGSAGIHIKGVIYTPTDMSYNEVLTALGATDLNA